MLVKDVVIEDLDVSTMAGNKQEVRNVYIRMKRVPATKWGQLDG